MVVHRIILHRRKDLFCSNLDTTYALKKGGRNRPVLCGPELNEWYKLIPRDKIEGEPKESYHSNLPFEIEMVLSDKYLRDGYRFELWGSYHLWYIDAEADRQIQIPIHAGLAGLVRKLFDLNKSINYTFYMAINVFEEK